MEDLERVKESVGRSLSLVRSLAWVNFLECTTSWVWHFVWLEALALKSVLRGEGCGHACVYMREVVIIAHGRCSPYGGAVRAKSD